MTAAEHDGHEDDFAEGEPGAAEGVVVVGDAGTEADGAEGGDGVEDHGPDGEARGWEADAVALDDADEEDGDEEPEGVGRELVFEVRLRKGVLAGYGQGREERYARLGERTLM